MADATPGTADVVATAVAGTAAPWLWFWMIRAEVTLLSIEPRNDCLKPLISTEKNTTRPMPIMSAAAVTAVRPVLRVVFSRAIRPDARLITPIGQPIRPASGRIRYFDTMARPMNDTIAPIAMVNSRCVVAPDPVTPWKTPRMPSTSRMPAM